MIDLEHRQMHRPNGLIDDFVVRGSPSDYKSFARQVRLAISSGEPERLQTSSRIGIEITKDPNQPELFTSLQNQDNSYPGMIEWTQRSLLMMRGSGEVLEDLYAFLLDLPQRGHGYSYIFEYSNQLGYAECSPEWRLHVQLP